MLFRLILALVAVAASANLRKAKSDAQQLIDAALLSITAEMQRQYGERIAALEKPGASRAGADPVAELVQWAKATRRSRPLSEEEARWLDLLPRLSAADREAILVRVRQASPSDRAALHAEVPPLGEPSPIDVVLQCPRCHTLHIDAPEPEKGWTNPLHKSHMCHACGCVWRPADVPTNGVAAVRTRGKADTWPMPEAPPLGDTPEREREADGWARRSFGSPKESSRMMAGCACGDPARARALIRYSYAQASELAALLSDPALFPPGPKGGES